LQSSSSLSRYLLVAYALLVIYASLHPLAGWSAVGIDPFAFLTAPLPRYVLRLDVLANFAGYAPLGFLWALALHPKRRGVPAAVAASVGAILLSVALESLQSFLPSRTPSNLDVLANGAGAIVGALLGARCADFLLLQHGLKAARYRAFRPGSAADLGLVLLALWLFTQLDAQSLLFGTGDLRPLFQDESTELHGAEVFIRAEALVACANTVAIGQLVVLLSAPGRSVRWLIFWVIACALALHAAAYGLFFGMDLAFNWLTPGAYLGAGCGLVAALAAVALPRPLQSGLCALAIMSAALIVNVAPQNPYLADALATWQQGYFFHFIGLTRLISGAWPFLALAYVVTRAEARERL
jgi:VanZ family protein